MSVASAMMDKCAGEDAQHPVISDSLTHISYLVSFYYDNGVANAISLNKRLIRLIRKHI